MLTPYFCFVSFALKYSFTGFSVDLLATAQGRSLPVLNITNFFSFFFFYFHVALIWGHLWASVCMCVGNRFEIGACSAELLLFCIQTIVFAFYFFILSYSTNALQLLDKNVVSCIFKIVIKHRKIYVLPSLSKFFSGRILLYLLLKPEFLNSD